MIAEAGSLLQPEENYRPDVISFVSEPLEEELPLGRHVIMRWKQKPFLNRIEKRGGKWEKAKQSGI